jgi:hypothetical protein
LDFGFRFAASVLLLAAAIALNDTVLIAVAIVMFISLPVSWKLGKLAAAIQRDAKPDEIEEGDALSRPLLERIVAGLKGDPTFKCLRATQIATHALSVYEMAATRPPNWTATIGLTLLYAGSIVVGIMLTFVLLLAPHWR